MAIYMNYDGIKGDVTESGHKDWIQCDSIAFSACRDAHTEQGQAAQRQGKQVAIGEIILTKPVCAGSPHLFTQSVVGLGKTVKLHITRTGDGQHTNYLEVTLDKCCITNYGMDSDGAAHSESVSLNFLKIEMKYIPVKPDGAPGDPIPVAFDVGLGEAVAA
jgi:type VI secretion system secreted protein Hcp